MITGRARWAPSATLSATPAICEADGIDRFGAILGDQSVRASHQGGHIPTSPADVLGVGAHGIGNGCLEAPRRPSGDPSEGGGQAPKRDGHHWSAAPVDSHGRHRLTGKICDGLRHEALQRVLRVAIGRQVPAVELAGGQHGCVFARAVLRDGPGSAMGRDPGGALILVVGEVRGVLQISFTESVRLQHLVHTHEVKGLSAVRGTSEG